MMMGTRGKESKPHIGIFGRRNNGKSSVMNALTQQDIAIVSDVAGTTTDPVKKSVEIPGVGPAIIIDTAGIDDTGDLGNQRIEKSKQVISTIDLAILVIIENTFGSFETELIQEFYNQGVTFFVIHNKSDIKKISEELDEQIRKEYKAKCINFCATNPENLNELVALLKTTIPKTAYVHPSILGDLTSYGDIVLLITPIDIEAPEGRLILPQVQTIRDALDNDCVVIILKEREVDAFLRKTKIKPKLAITDSSIFLKASASIPSDIPLTGFSVLLARYKGDFEAYLKGTPKISELKNGDRILLLESCTHHVSCDDIGRIKIPRWINQFTGKKLEYDVVAGLNKLSKPIEEYALIIQCGGCVVTRKQLVNRLRPAKELNIPITNYGMAIAYVQGIYNRAIAPFVGEQSIEEDYL